MRVSKFRVGHWWKKSNLLFWKEKARPNRYIENTMFGFHGGSVCLPDNWKESSLFENCSTLENFSAWIIREKNEACGYPDIWVWLQRWSRNTLPPLKRNPSKLKNFRGRSCRKTLSAWLQRTLLLKLCKLRRKLQIFGGLPTKFPIWGAKYESVTFLGTHNLIVFFFKSNIGRENRSSNFGERWGGTSRSLYWEHFCQCQPIRTPILM